MNCVLKDIEASGGKMKFASDTFQLVEAPPIEVRMNDFCPVTLFHYRFVA